MVTNDMFNDLSLHLKNKGKVLSLYHGTGKVTFDKVYESKFVIIQIASGDIYASLNIDCPALFISADTRSNLKFSGVTSDKTKIQFEGIVSNISGNSSTELIFNVQEASIGSKSTSKLFNLQFQIANLIFPVQNHENLSFCLDGFDFIFRKLDDYESTVSNLKSKKGIDVTCILEIKNVKLINVKSILEAVSNICALMTFAQGCSVNWISYHFVKMDTSIYSYHKSAIIKNYNTLPSIDSDELECFISSTIERFSFQNITLELNKFINEVVDAKMQQDYFEFRALKLVIALEHLKSNFSRHNNTEYITPYDQKTFSKKIYHCLPEIESSLQSEFGDLDHKQIKIMAHNLLGSNRNTFAEILFALLDTFHIVIDVDKVNTFIRIRNSIVHKVEFIKNKDSAWDQYSFLMSFIDMLILGILDYHGCYLDWSKLVESKGISENMKTKVDFNNEKGK